MSLSAEYINFMQKLFPEHTYRSFMIGNQIEKILKDEAYRREILDEIKSSDGVIWIVPVYFTTVPSQLQRFIDYIFDDDKTAYFSGKYTAVFMTSVNYFDHTAGSYMRAVTEDMGMKYVDCFSGRPYIPVFDHSLKSLQHFFAHFFEVIENEIPVSKEFVGSNSTPPHFKPIAISDSDKTENINAVLLTDVTQEDVNLQNMIDTYIKAAQFPVTVINLHDISIKTGCVACTRCTYDSVCSIKDDFYNFFENDLKKADMVIFAASIKHRFFSGRWKMFFDRSFYNNHIPSLPGKQTAFLISGNLWENQFIKDSIEGIMYLYNTNLNDIITDTSGDAAHITALLSYLPAKMVKAFHNKYSKPQTYLGVGGQKIFRDLVYISRSSFYAEYKHFKKTLFKSLPHRFPLPIFFHNLKILKIKMTRDKNKLIKKRQESNKDWIVKRLKAFVGES